MVKSPKLFLRDSGLLHSLLDLESLDDVQSHPVWGASWEGYVIENLRTAFPKHNAGFLRTSNGAEADLVLSRGPERILVECKASKTPRPSRGLYELINALQPTRTVLVAPVDEPYPFNAQIEVCPLSALVNGIYPGFVPN